MYYQKWNDHLFNYFFNPTKSRQTVLLDISEQELCGIYTEIFGMAPETATTAVRSFVSALNAGPTIFNIRSKSVQKYPTFCEVIKNGYRIYYFEYNKEDIRLSASHSTPPFFAYAIGFIYALKANKERGLYDAFRGFMGRGKQQIGSDRELADCIDIVWWSIQNFLDECGEEIGYFFNKRDVAKNRKFVDKVYSQFIIPRIELLRMPAVFWALELTKDDATEIDIPKVFLSNESELKRSIPTALGLMKGKDADGLLVLDIIRTLLSSFDGWSPKVEKTGQIVTEQNLTKLWLAIHRDGIGGFEIGYHFCMPGFEGESVLLGGQEIFLNDEFWSGRLKRNDGHGIDFPYSVKDDVNGRKVIFKPQQSKIYAFSPAMDKGYPSKVNIQTGYISSFGRQYILLHDKIFSSLKRWIDLNNGKREQISQDNWSLWSFEGMRQEGPIEPLKYSKVKRLDLHGGLRAKGNHSYVLGYPLILTLEGAKGDEELLMEGYGTMRYSIENKGFLINGVGQAGEYSLRVNSASDGELEMGSFSKLQFKSIDATAVHDGTDMQLDRNDSYCQEKGFMEFQHLQRNIGANLHYPPQLLEWAENEVGLEEGSYSALAQELLSYIAYRGEIGSAVLSESLITFYRRYQELRNVEGQVVPPYATFKKNTISSLVEGCRIMPTYNELGSLVKVVPVSPFLCRLANAYSVDSGLKNKSVKSFDGELYVLGGCIPSTLLVKIFGIAMERYRDSVLVKLIGEWASGSLNPVAIYIYINKACNFIDSISEEFGINGPNNNYMYFPVVEDISRRLRFAMDNPGQHQNFHDGESCEVFGPDTLKFNPIGGRALEQISLARYQINNYRKLHILRNHGNSYNVQGGWGKYLYLHLIEKDQGQVHYDPITNILAIRTTLGIPWPLDRLLYLASGRLGRRLPMRLGDGTLAQVTRGSYFTVYQGILETTASAVIGRLGQRFGREHYINIEFIR